MFMDLKNVHAFEKAHEFEKSSRILEKFMILKQVHRFGKVDVLEKKVSTHLKKVRKFEKKVQETNIFYFEKVMNSGKNSQISEKDQRFEKSFYLEKIMNLLMFAKK